MAAPTKLTQSKCFGLPRGPLGPCPRQDDVEGLAGPPRDVPRFIPVNLLLIPDRVTTFPEAVAALRHCDLLCRMLTEQRSPAPGPPLFGGGGL